MSSSCGRRRCSTTSCKTHFARLSRTTDHDIALVARSADAGSGKGPVVTEPTHSLIDSDSSTAGGLADRLEGAPDALAVPADRSRPSTLTSRVDQVDQLLDHDRLRSLEGLAHRCGVGLRDVVLAGFELLLARTTDELDLVVGCGETSTAGRDDVLVVRLRLDLDADVGSLVGSVATAVERAAQGGARPVADLLAELGLEPGPAKHPLFQVGFVESDRPRDERWPASSPVPPDLVLSWYRSEQGLSLRLHYAPELFDRSRVQRMLGHLSMLLAGMTADARVPVGALPLLSDEELAGLAGWNATAQDHDGSAPWPLVSGTRSTQYRTPSPSRRRVLHSPTASSASRGAQVARLLRDAGVDSDVTVAVCAERSVEMVVASWPCSSPAARTCRSTPRYPPSRPQLHDHDSGARCVLTQSTLRIRLPAGFPGQVLLLDDLPGRSATRTPTTAARPVRLRPRVRHLHLRVDRPAQGRRHAAVRSGQPAGLAAAATAVRAAAPGRCSSPR